MLQEGEPGALEAGTMPAASGELGMFLGKHEASIRTGEDYALPQDASVLE